MAAPLSGPLDGQRLGYIGLGLMGRPMALHLHAAGAQVTIANRSQAVVGDLAARGLVPANSPAEVAAAADIVITCLTDTDALDTVLHGEAGLIHGLIEGLAPGMLVIDMGSSKVRETRAWAAEVADRECDYVDAPVSGGAVGAEAATLSIMAGGSAAALARARPILEVLGSRLTHVGPVGTGQVAKIANQAIVGMTIAAVSEALALAERAGADPAMVREALIGGFADSRILELHGQRMIDADFAPGGRATVQNKDIGQGLELAAQVGLELPSLALNKTLWERMIAAGWHDLDHSGLIKIYRDED